MARRDVPAQPPSEGRASRLDLFYHPCTYQIFARYWMHELSRAAGRRLTLADVPDAALDHLADLGVDYVYLTGVFTLGEEGRRISREHAPFRADYDRSLPGWTEADVVGSPFAVARYAVDPAFGGDAALAELRRRLAARGIGLILDWVTNHVARDHHWMRERPEVFLRDPESGRVLEGRDPHFPPWPDTAQLDFRTRSARAASIEALMGVAGKCDGVRCDMAMLVLESVFCRTWAELPAPRASEEARGEFWAEAIDAVRREHPGFLFVAEVYWDLEWRLQMLGFDYTYDKALYDRLQHASAAAIRAHLGASADYQRRCVRFLENHDEARAAAAFAPDRHRAAAVIAATAPGMRFFHDGQIEGRRVRPNVHLARRAEESGGDTEAFYKALLAALRKPALRRGSFAQLMPRDGGPAPSGRDAFVAHRWDAPEGGVVVVVNYGTRRAQCRVALDLAGTAGRRLRLVDLLTREEYERDGDELQDPARGLYVDLPAYGAHLFEVVRVG